MHIVLIHNTVKIAKHRLREFCTVVYYECSIFVDNMKMFIYLTKYNLNMKVFDVYSTSTYYTVDFVLRQGNYC